MKNQILSLVFFILTTTLMVVQGETKGKRTTTDQSETLELITIAQTEVRQVELSSVNYQ
ncbi:MAG: hypothetical protein ACI863_000962 [Flavobacteriales bacterium]|jgi:hypothetical protein|tara:strand:- start:588 stop:764 length:177 start_codon:yes stop_codon:yes gene_type:complete